MTAYNAYNARKVQLNILLTAVRNELERFNAGERDDIEDWNLHHDIEASTEKALHDLDRQWETRNYTTADWTSLNLIANNID